MKEEIEKMAKEFSEKTGCTMEAAIEFAMKNASYVEYETRERIKHSALLLTEQ